jgi:hypothetical protein
LKKRSSLSSKPSSLRKHSSFALSVQRDNGAPMGCSVRIRDHFLFFLGRPQAAPQLWSPICESRDTVDASLRQDIPALELFRRFEEKQGNDCNKSDHEQEQSSVVSAAF